jgi:hypothetical protein
VTPSLATVFIALMVVASGCGVEGLNFHKDERVTITAPADRAQVRLPLTVTWRSRDFEVKGKDGSARPDAGYFGVYVDRAPQPPQKTQAWLARDDQRCREVPSCPDEEFLAEMNVFSTTRHSFTVERLPQPTTNAPRRREFHEVTIVLLSGIGERIGESAFTVQFEVERE